MQHSFLTAAGDAAIDVLTRLSTSPPGKVDPLSGPWTILGSTAVCSLLFIWFQTGVFTPKTGAAGHVLTRAERLEWNVRLVSTIHAVVLVIGSILCFLDARFYSTQRSYLFGYSAPPDIFARIFLGYLIYDLAVISYHYRTLRDTSGIVHHLIFIPVTAYVLAHSYLKFPFTWLALGEVSTPTVNLRWHLAVLGKKKGKLYVFNGLLLALLFLVVRVFGYGAGMIQLFMLRRYWNVPEVPALHKGVIYLLAAGWLLNSFWMVKIAQGVQRSLSRQQHKKKM